MQYLEKNLWLKIRKKFKGIAERIENLLNRGTPDVSVSNHNFGDFWVELKVCRTKKLKGPKDLLSPIQKVWHKKRVKAGGRVYTLISNQEHGLFLYLASVEKNSLQFELRSLDEVFENGLGYSNK